MKGHEATVFAHRGNGGGTIRFDVSSDFVCDRCFIVPVFDGDFGRSTSWAGFVDTSEIQGIDDFVFLFFRKSHE